MPKKHYDLEREGQIDFFDNYNIPYTDDNSILVDNTDGIYHGNILEFKLNISNTGRVLFQAIKYLSKMRIRGESVPARILLIDLNDTKVYVFNSIDYIDDIQKVYVGAASKDNASFSNSVIPEKIFDYTELVDSSELKRLLINKTDDERNWYIPIDIDENCIIGWAERYYKEKPNATKGDFIGEESGKVKLNGEIREPRHFRGLINPYTAGSNERFKYLMDCLNDRLNKKNLGAFYTPIPYCNKAAELVKKAVERVPEGNDYIILDRCAGTGNLESALYNQFDRNGSELISHCVVSTYEYYEYKVLMERIGEDVRDIIPPTEANVVYESGKVSNADAISKDYIDNPLITKYINDPKCTIILFENPPYAETTSIEHQKEKKGKQSSVWKKSYVVTEMKKDVKGTASNDLGNAFIWSAFKYYLRQPTDSYIVFSPVKYWKAQHLVSKKFIDGFAFNRRHFHTNIDACIMCALWSNEEDYKTDRFTLKGFDIEKDGKLQKSPILLKIKQIKSLFSEKYYGRLNKNEYKTDGILIGLDGTEADSSVKKRIVPLYGEDLIGYLVSDSVGFDNPDAKSSLLIAGRYNGNGFYLKRDCFLEKLPMFCASRYITYNRAWTERARIMKSGDGADRFFKDLKSNKIDQQLRKCLLFTCLETQNHMRSFTGSDNRFYRNELCLDTSNGETLASKELSSMNRNNLEEKLFNQWDMIISESKKCKNYNSDLTYGIYQIIDELNTFQVDEHDKKRIYDYPILNGYLDALKQLVKEYYVKEIVPFLFEYEFLK